VSSGPARTEPGAGEERARPAIGVLGSAFNPPHLGHLALAQEALWQLGLEEVVLMPTGEAPHKRILDDPGRELRLAMTRLAAADDPRFTVSTLEVEREGPSYTYETLRLLAREKGDPDLVFVMGADAAVGLESWREPEQVVELARLAVARRAGISEADVASVMRSLGAEGRATVLEMPQFGVSSSAVRERAAGGRPLRYLVPEAVARFIEEKGIYS
jgi:nicotinate-nucleotide adenylyltransferase